MLGVNSNTQPWSSSSSVSASSTRSNSPSTSHPLNSHAPSTSTSISFYSSLTPSTSSSSIALNSASSANNVVRSRKIPTSGTQQPQHQHHRAPHAVDPEVTRPSLQRLTKKNSGILKEAIGKGKTRQSFDELSGNTTNGDSVTAETDVQEPEREVLIHEIAKTDTLASVALQYGITPQALRTSNRLWANDSINLRKNLKIPLDLCHLPSSSSIERVSRDEDGSLVIWERSSPLSTPTPSDTQYQQDRIWSPSARRVVSEMGGVSAWSSTADLLGLDSARNSIDEDSRTDWKGKGRAIDPSSYLPSTNNPYSNFSNPPSPPRLASPFDFFGRSSPLPNIPHMNGNGIGNMNGNGHIALASPPSTYSSPDEPHWPPSRPESTDSNFSHASSQASSQPATIARRTLVVEKVKASELKFFPKPQQLSSPSFSSFPTPTDLDKTPTPTSISSFSAQQSQPSPHIGHGMAKTRRKSTALGFPDLGPLATSFAKLVPPSGGGTGQHWSKKWDIFDYGGEEEGAEGAISMSGLRVQGSENGTTPKKRNAAEPADRRSRSVF